MKKIFLVIAMFIVVLSDAEINADTNSSILSYLANPEFSGNDFLEKITGSKAKIELIDYEEGYIYFSINRNEYDNVLTLKKLTRSPKNVEFGITSKGRNIVNSGSDEFLSLGTKAYYKEGRYLFRILIDDFKINYKKKIVYQLGNYRYDISPEELVPYIDNEVIYGGYLNVLDSVSGNDITAFSNHGVFVAKKEPSLQRLVARITQGLVTKEEKIQRLLDFVTKEIAYNWKEVYATSETLKRPNEILMTGESDCSGKVILFASLLEQIDIEYLVVYSGDENKINHIFVAVKGDFDQSNKLSFKIKKHRLFVAETTYVGYRIGKTHLEKNPLSLKNKLYFQIPGEDSKIINGRTGEVLPFL